MQRNKNNVDNYLVAIMNMARIDKQDVVVKYLKGISVRDIAKEYGVTREAIYQVLRQEPLFEIWKRNHYCVKHQKQFNAIVQAKDRKDLQKRLGFKTEGAVIALLKRMAKYGCIDYGVVEAFMVRKTNIAEEIRKLLKLGMCNKDIAKELGVSEKYVSNVKWLMMKNERTS